ncbi:site-specific integrase [Pseudomaricurvus alkylphenolicus]|uniref:site-specific integrase n=1 Tax=Pseudomaricurvus alkylphenolicus TaxID=1306991 RepID=UPI00141EA9AB|nr:site-specific integrase [Pseudomaricurvus alkylphenolicus]NIB44870.1 site-specific integrase [Pseudomaricurvus alkylphenolicus]
MRTENGTPYLYLKRGTLYFSRRINKQLVRVSLKTNDEQAAAYRIAALYPLSNQLKRLGVSGSALVKALRHRVEQLHEESLLAQCPQSVTDDLPAGHRQLFLATPSALPSTDLLPSPVIAPSPTLSTPAAPPTAPLQVFPAAPNPRLVSDTLEEAVEVLSRDTSAENVRKYREAFTEFDLLFPGVHFHDIRPTHASEHQGYLLRIPDRRTVRLPYKRMPIQQVVEQDIPTDLLLSNTTINDRIKRLKALWGWAAEQEMCSGTNPWSGNSLRLEEKPRKRVALRCDDVQELLSSPLFTDETYRSGEHGSRSWWWLIVLGLLTGARIGELTQLTLDDIREVDGALCISINEENGKSVKTAAGVRLVPVHPVLLTLGFEVYLRDLHNQGHLHVLPRPNEADDGPQRASKWFNGHYRNTYLPHWGPAAKSFHSMRHGFTTRALKDLGLHLQQTQAIIGHEPDHMGETKRYAQGQYPVGDLAQLIASFDYGEVDWRGLRGGWEGLKDA